MPKIVPVLLSGGSGTRLWPLSRSHYPKQFLSLNSDDSMLQETCKRLADLDTDSMLLVVNEEHRFIAAEQIRQIGLKSRLILEPDGRNTAAAIALAAHHLLQQQGYGESPIMLVLPADHIIEAPQKLIALVEQVAPVALEGKLITFGVKPEYPETGYGYIKKGVQVSEQLFDISSFVEKPTLHRAETLLEEGEYLWNSGMFLFSAEQYLTELQTFEPEIAKSCSAAMAAPEIDRDFIRPDRVQFCNSPGRSIDHAIMEKTEHGLVAPLDVGWKDIGSWHGLTNHRLKDDYGNTVSGDVLLESVENSFIYAGNRLVSAVGVDNLIIVDTDDALLVADKEHYLDIKAIVEQLRVGNRDELHQHLTVERPWGRYQIICEGKAFKVKRITVEAGQRLSLQKHQYRAEHWVVVSGEALVRCGDQQFQLTENQSTYIPKGELHQLINSSDLPLEIIEVQTGDSLHEDDIERIDDQYGR